MYFWQFVHIIVKLLAKSLILPDCVEHVITETILDDAEEGTVASSSAKLLVEGLLFWCLVIQVDFEMKA